MRQQQETLHGLGVQVAIVTFENTALARAYVEDTELVWPLLVDENRSLYHAYGMERGRWWQIYSPSTLWTYLRLMLQGRRLEASGEDVNQLGGDVLIDPAGIVRLHHVSADPADRPSVERLLAVIRAGGDRQTSG